MTPAHGRRSRQGAARHKNNGQGEPAMHALQDWEARTGDFLRLIRACMSEEISTSLTKAYRRRQQRKRVVGPAAQSLAAVMMLAGDNDVLFARLERIAELAVLDKRTVQRQLATLCERKWLKRRGRERSTDKGPTRLRRTITYEITNKTKTFSDGAYNCLPRWAAAKLATWSSRAVFAAAVSRSIMVEIISEKGCADDRELLSVGEIQKQTGLERHAVYAGMSALEDCGLVEVFRGEHTALRTPLYIKLAEGVTVDVADKKKRKTRW